MVEAKNTYSKLGRIIDFLNGCWKYRHAVTGIVAAVIAIWFWRFWLLSDDGISGSWYTNFVEDNLWMNILLFIYSIYIIVIWVYYVCRFNRRWYHFIIYAIVVATLWIVPALEPVNTPIDGMSYHLWMTILLVVATVLEVYFYFKNPNPVDDEYKSGGFIAYVMPKCYQSTGWNDYITKMLKMVGYAQLKEDSFTIGVAGSWGSGKTTFYKAVREKLEKETEFKVCEFKPWQVVNYTQLSAQFFATFKDHLIDRGILPESDLISDITKYAEVLESLPKVSNYAQPVISAIRSQQDESLQKLHDDIEKMMKNNNYLTAVMIDDMDRLNKNELMEVLRLIRMSANFKNVLFIITYDKKHIADTIGSNGTEYLKKIVNVEIKLPPLENYKYRDLLLNNIELIVPDLSSSQKGELKRACSVKNKLNGGILLHSYFRNFRDLVRFSNHLGLVLNYLQEQKQLDKYNIQDLFWLEMLHYYEEKVYYQLQEPHWTLLERKETKKTKQTYLSLTDETISSNISGLGILLELFDVSKLRSVSSLIWLNNFNNYFAHRLLDNAVSLKEFAIVVEHSEELDILHSRVDEWYNGHAKISFLQAVKNYPHNNVFISELAIRNYVSLLFKLLKMKAISVDEFKDYIGTKGHLSYFERIDSRYMEKLLREAIYACPAISWNHLLTAMCVTLNDSLEDPDILERVYNNTYYVINQEQLKIFAKLNYERYFEGEVMSLSNLFNERDKHMRFLQTLSYEYREATYNGKKYKTHSNLLGDYLLEMWHPSVQSKLGNKEFRYIYENLIEISGASKAGDESLAHELMQTAIECTLGSLENFEILIKTYFKLNNRHRNYCKDLGLNV